MANQHRAPIGFPSGSTFSRWLGAVGVGAGAMYLLDRDAGRRRRALLADRFKHGANVVETGVSKATRDLEHRLDGLQSRLAGSGKHRRDAAAGFILVERIRARLGHVVSHPHAIQVEAREGRVILRGAILKDEAAPLLSVLRKTPGVVEVIDAMARGEEGSHPALQGKRRIPIANLNGWRPATRLVAGTAGGALAIAGLAWRRPAGALFSAAGAGLLVRALTNLTPLEFVGLRNPHAIDFQRSITVQASPDEIFTFLENPENFARFMSHIREVRNTGIGHSHWVLATPVGLSVSWDAMLTAREAGKSLAWRSVPGSLIGHATTIRLSEDPRGGTRLDIQFSYAPPAGILGHLIAKLFGTDPKRLMDEDLVRLKSLMEVGKTTIHGHVFLRDDAGSRPATEHAPTLQ